MTRYLPTLGPMEVVILLVLALLLFGKNLPKMRRDLMQSLTNRRSALRRNSAVGFLVLMFGVLFLFIARNPPAPQDVKVPPKLAVLVVFDQLRGDYLDKWKDLFAKDGFRRLQTEGAWFTNCHYPYSDTVTSIGHASLMTGCSPNKHGIIGNTWYDRTGAKVVTSVESEQHRQVPPAPPTKDGKPAPGVASTRRRQPTLGDSLQAATKGKGKVVVLSIKDTAAAMMAAFQAQIVCWFSAVSGMFVTSTCYAEQLPPFVVEFNKTRPGDAWFGKSWSRFRGDLDYVKLSGPDAVKAEGIGYKQGFVFPHPLDGGLKEVGEKYYKAMLNSPHGNELLLALVKKAIEAEKLGQGNEPDLLCVSFSSNDYVGHCYGPDSQEVLDITLHSDRIVKELLDCLDTHVGKGRYVLALSADHGVCPIPELSASQGKKAGRVSPTLLTTKLPEYLSSKFADGAKLPWVEKNSGPWVYLNQGLIKQRGLDAAEVQKLAAEWLATQPGIHRSYARTQLSRRMEGDAMGERVQRSFHAERSGDVMVVIEPYHLLTGPITAKEDAYRTSHGTPHSYDTHVPLVVFGPDIVPGHRDHPVTPQAAAVVLARGLGIAAPSGAEAKVPAGLFK